MDEPEAINSLGWQPFFQQQLSLDEWESTFPVRVVEFHRSEMKVLGERGNATIELHHTMPPLVVGDWILLDDEGMFLRLLERKTCFVRKAAGSEVREQLISANVDTAFIVSSLNRDFSLNRIERYLALVHEAGAEPVVLLSKADLVEDYSSWVARVRDANPGLIVEAINCRDEQSLSALSPWLIKGNTVAVLGSSGVGKSTLINTLLSDEVLETAAIREEDSKGRHTTTSRALVKLMHGGLMLDTPGMREIQIANSEEGIDATFAEITALASTCKFSDCKHEGEPDCAVIEAIEKGALDERRLKSYLKLRREDALNSATLAERRAQDKALGKFYKRTLSQAERLKGR